MKGKVVLSVVAVVLSFVSKATGNFDQFYQLRGRLIFQEEFNTLNKSRWQHLITAWRGGNNEFEYYTDRPENRFNNVSFGLWCTTKVNVNSILNLVMYAMEFCIFDPPWQLIVSAKTFCIMGLWICGKKGAMSTTTADVSRMHDNFNKIIYWPLWLIPLLLSGRQKKTSSIRFNRHGYALLTLSALLTARSRYALKCPVAIGFGLVCV